MTSLNKISTLTILLISLFFLSQLDARMRPFSSFIQTKVTQFSLNNSTFLFNGFNAYWMMQVASDPSQRYKVSEVFRQASAASLTVCRTWAFSDGGNDALRISPGVYNEYVFQALDFVVSEAAKYRVYLILSLVNNYKDYGGRGEYVNWARNSGVQISNDDDFYTNVVVKGYYKDHIKRVLTRINTITGIAYKDDPTIMAWELMNEPRCQSDHSGKILTGWVQEMASHVKSIDKKHLLEIGMEGFYGDSIPDRKRYNPGYQVGTDFISSNLVKEIDFTSIHAYPDIWLSGDNDGAQMGFLRKWIMSHWSDSRNVLKKPMIFSEFGKSRKDPEFNVASRDLYLNGVYGTIYRCARNGGIGGGLVWQIMSRGMESYYDGYEIVLSESPSTSTIIVQQSRQMRALERKMSGRP